MLIVPYVHTFGELSGKSRIYYRAATVCMAVLPVLYVIAGAFLMTKWYYRLKIQKPLEERKRGWNISPGRIWIFRWNITQRMSWGIM